MQTHTVKESVVTLLLPLSQVNVILRALAELPLKESRLAFNNVEQQANADLQRQSEFMQKPSEDQQVG